MQHRIGVDQLTNLISIHTEFKNKQFASILKLLTDSLNVCIDYESHKNRDTDFGFNIFNLISDTYHKENFHSDILRAFLDPNEKHNEGYRYLHQFINLISSNSEAIGVYIDCLNYKNSTVIREQGKIDVLIRDNVSNKAIIIENKINRAPDQHRQIPRYVEYVRKLGLTLDAIVYLVLDENDNKKPETLTWEAGDEEMVFDKFVSIVAFNESENCLLNGWIYPSLYSTKYIDALIILKQYGSLIQKLGEKHMDKPLMKLFLQKMLESENYNTALSLKSMVEDLIEYRAQHIVDTFINQPMPFDQVYFENNSAVFGHWKNMRLVIQIYPSQDIYSFTFGDRDFRDKVEKENLAEIAINELKYNSEFIKENDGTMKKIFKFPLQEIEMYEFIRNFKSQLSNLKYSGSKRKSG